MMEEKQDAKGKVVPDTAVEKSMEETPLKLEEASVYKVDQSHLDENMAYAYITFRSQDDYALAMRAFNRVTWRWFCCVKCCSCCCNETRERHDELAFFDHLLVVDESCEPDFILWENLGIGPTSRMIRNACISFMYFLIICGSIIGMAIFSVYSA